MSDPTPNESVLARSLSRIAAILKCAREAQSSEAVDFTVFDYIRPNENMVSRMMADLMDPNGTHGQATVFLDSFLQRIDFPNAGDLGKALIDVEDPTLRLESKRRIDIVIKTKNWVIGIENKPWARDQEQQVVDYIKELKGRRRDSYCLLYLTPHGTEPTSIGKAELESGRNDGSIKLVSYGTISEWLGECERQCTPPRVRGFITAFREYVEQSILECLPPREGAKMIDYLLDEQHNDDLGTALEILRLREGLHAQLKERLMNTLRETMPGGWSIVKELDERDSLRIKTSDTSSWHFRLEREGSRWWYGIRHDDKSTEEQRAHINELCNRLREGFPGKEYPPLTAWWRWLDEDDDHELRKYGDWSKSVVPWLHMQNGELAGHVLALAKRLTDELEKP